jgi:predicted dehydrogenase
MFGEALDLVVVCVPHHIGRQVVECAAEHGVHVLKEKPFATSLADARELAETCAGAGIELMVTLQRRFNPTRASPSSPIKSAPDHRRCAVHAAYRRPL